MPKKESTLTLRLPIEAKQEVDRRAEKAGTTTSQYAREILLSDDNVIFLDGGTEIAKALSELYIEIHKAVIHDKAHTLDQKALMDKLEEVSAKFSDIMEQITPLSAFDNEKGGDE